MSVFLEEPINEAAGLGNIWKKVKRAITGARKGTGSMTDKQRKARIEELNAELSHIKSLRKMYDDSSNFPDWDDKTEDSIWGKVWPLFKPDSVSATDAAKDKAKVVVAKLKKANAAHTGSLNGKPIFLDKTGVFTTPNPPAPSLIVVWPKAKTLPAAIRDAEASKDVLQGKNLKEAIFVTDDSMYPILEEVDYSDKRPMIAIDFDGVLHAYDGDSKEDFGPPISDSSTDAIQWIRDLVDCEEFSIVIHSARSRNQKGVDGMRQWMADSGLEDRYLRTIAFPIVEKPMAAMYIDDRAHRFNGEFPSIAELSKKMTTWWENE